MKKKPPHLGGGTFKDYTTRNTLAQAKTVIFGLKSRKNCAIKRNQKEGSKPSLFLAPVMLQWL